MCDRGVIISSLGCMALLGYLPREAAKLASRALDVEMELDCAFASLDFMSDGRCILGLACPFYMAII